MQVTSSSTGATRRAGSCTAARQTSTTATPPERHLSRALAQLAPPPAVRNRQVSWPTMHCRRVWECMPQQLIKMGRPLALQPAPVSSDTRFSLFTGSIHAVRHPSPARLLTAPCMLSRVRVRATRRLAKRRADASAARWQPAAGAGQFQRAVAGAVPQRRLLAAGRHRRGLRPTLQRRRHPPDRGRVRFSACGSRARHVGVFRHTFLRGRHGQGSANGCSCSYCCVAGGKSATCVCVCVRAWGCMCV